MSKIAIFAKIREIFVNCALPVQLHLSRTPFFPSAIFFENFTIFAHFLLGFKRKMLIFAEWNLPQRFFRARPAKKAGSETWGRGLGHMPQKSIKSLRDSSLYMYSGAPIFFLRNFLRNFLRHFFGKIASRATKMLERALISQGKVKSALVARETC